MKLIFLLLLPLTMFSQNHCSEYIVGKFKPKYGSLMNDYEIVRTDSTITNYDKLLNTTSQYKIIWTDSCQYKLKRISRQGYDDINGFDLKYLTYKIQEVNDLEFVCLIVIPEDSTLVDTKYLVKID